MHMKTKIAVPFALAVILLAGAVSPAAAAPLKGKDAKGDSGDASMDILSYSVAVTAREVALTVEMARAVPRGEQAFIQVDLDTNRDGKTDASVATQYPWKAAKVTSDKGKTLCAATASPWGPSVKVVLPAKCLGYPLAVAAQAQLVGGEDERAWDRAGGLDKQATRKMQQGVVAVKADRRKAQVFVKLDPHFNSRVATVVAAARGTKPKKVAEVEIDSKGQGYLVLPAKKLPPRTSIVVYVDGKRAATGRR